MPKYSIASRDNLKTCDPKLQELFNEVIKHYDNKIIEGHRPKEKQDRLFLEGRTKVKWPESKHNSTPAKACDSVPYPIKWPTGALKWFLSELKNKDPHRFVLIEKDVQALFRLYHYGGFVRGVAAALGIDIRWGGDWDNDFDLFDQNFMDLDHFELTE